MLITARFPSVCGACSRPIVAGDRISYVRGQKALHALCSDEGKEVQAKTGASRAKTIAANPPRGDSFLYPIPCPEGLEFYPFQIAGIHYALSCHAAGRGVLNADEMGLGKSPSAIGIINASPDVVRVLVVCPASLKRNWRAEILRWSTKTTRVRIVGLKKEDQNRAGAAEVYIDVVNPEILSKLPPGPVGWDLVIVDEVQRFKNPKAARTVALRSNVVSRCRKNICLSGTPFENKPVELFPVLQIVDPAEWDPGSYSKGEWKKTARAQDSSSSRNATATHTRRWSRAARRFGISTAPRTYPSSRSASARRAWCVVSRKTF